MFSLTAETELHTDACKIGIGAILLQKSGEDQNFHPVFYFSKKTSPCEERYSSYQLEVLAIVRALKKFRVYLLGLKFVIVTDCAAFKATMEKKELTARISGWALQLQEFDFRLEHRPGTKMRHVDSLSRNPIVLLVEHDLMTRVKAAQKKDQDLKPIFHILENDGTYNDFITNHGILFKIVHGALVLVVPRGMQREVVRYYHELGHFGARKVEELVQRDFFIPNLVRQVSSCIKNCVTCILAERKLGKKEGLLNPLPKGDVPLSTYHADHMGHLTATKKNYQYILSIIDSFSKFVWLYPTKGLTTKEVLQKLDLQKAVFGNPANIIADRGTCFTSAEFKDYCEKERIELHNITTGMPSGNGQVERLNRTIIPALAKLSRDDPGEWYKYVDRLQRYLNNTYQRSINMTPFELMMGVKMRYPEDLRVMEAIEMEIAHNFCRERDDDRQQAKQQIAKIQSENQKSYNHNRKTATCYDKGDIVAIKRVQYSGSKLLPKYLGPYRVTKSKRGDRYDVEKIGDGEGPRTTSTGAMFMKPYYDGLLTDEESDEIDDQSAGTSDEAGGPSGI